jgi:hypothetical protein
MVRHLTTLVLGGILGSMVLVGNAEACHRNNCRHAAPVACATPVCTTKVVCAAPKPAPCVKPVAQACAPKVKCCKLTLPKLCLPKLCLPKLCQKKSCAPAPVAVACATPVSYAAPAGYPVASPQASAQH